MGAQAMGSIDTSDGTGLGGLLEQRVLPFAPPARTATRRPPERPTAAPATGAAPEKERVGWRLFALAPLVPIGIVLLLGQVVSADPAPQTPVAGLTGSGNAFAGGATSTRSRSQREGQELGRGGATAEAPASAARTRPAGGRHTNTPPGPTEKPDDGLLPALPLDPPVVVPAVEAPDLPAADLPSAVELP